MVVSGVLTSHGPCGRILDLLVIGAFDLCADDRILAEYAAVLRREEFGIAAQDVDELLALFRTTAIHIVASPLSVTLPDPDDLAFLETAAASGSVLVTGNLRHFPPPSRCGVTVVRPAEFLERM